MFEKSIIPKSERYANIRRFPIFVYSDIKDTIQTLFKTKRYEGIIPEEKYRKITGFFSKILIAAVAIIILAVIASIFSHNSSETPLSILYALLFALFVILYARFAELHKESIKWYRNWVDGTCFAPMRAFKVYNRVNRENGYEGYYVYHNITKDSYTVGSAADILAATENAFLGQDSQTMGVGKEYREGDEFEIRLIPGTTGLVSTDNADEKKRGEEQRKKFEKELRTQYMSRDELLETIKSENLLK